MLPVWRVVLNSGELFYVEAFSGAVEGTQDGKETADARMAR
ncbi:hypothetical protein N6H14_10230 [Paenibacillus sp. CC-CFT747]|nr:hypothetical protein N6H14_10230 [Paenibacillus sp. CC-CFT747]